MKSISTLALIGLIFFACKLCSFSNNRNRSNSNSNSNSGPSSQATMYAREFIKPELGRFSRSKNYTKEELRKTAAGFTVKMIEQAGDCAGGEYTGGSGPAALMACSYSGSSLPATLIAEIEQEIKNDRGMRFVRAVPTNSGKRVEATDSRGRGVVAWNNGHWLFMTIGNTLADTTALADAVGY